MAEYTRQERMESIDRILADIEEIKKHSSNIGDSSSRKKIMGGLVSVVSFGLIPVAIFCACKAKEATLVKNFDLPNTDTAIHSFADSTYLDELFSPKYRKTVADQTNDNNFLSSILKLENMLDISEKTSEITNTIGYNELEDEELIDIDVDNFKIDYEEYQKLIAETPRDEAKVEQSVKTMSKYAKYANEFIAQRGYAISAKYATLAIKSVVMETLGDKDLDNMSKITILSGPESIGRSIPARIITVEREDGVTERFYFASNSEENALIYNIEECTKHIEEDNNADYDEKRNDTITEVLNRVKLTIAKNYEQETIRISSNSDTNSAKKAYELVKTKDTSDK